MIILRNCEAFGPQALGTVDILVAGRQIEWIGAPGEVPPQALGVEDLDVTGRRVILEVTAYPVAEDEDAWSATAAVERYWDAGLPPERLTVSSDAGGCLPEFDADGRVTTFGVGSTDALGHVLRQLLCNGSSLEHALAPFTSNVAAPLRLPRKGRLRRGADADMVTLDDKGNVADVMANGRWHKRDVKTVTRGTFE